MRLEGAGAFEYGFVQFNLHDGATGAPHPVLGNREVRRALTRALDRPLMVSSVFDSAGAVALGPFVRRQWTADSTLRQLGFDRVGAERTLDSLGWRRAPGGMRQKNGRPLALTLLVTAGSPSRMRFAEMIQEQLRQAGAQLRIEFLDGRALGQRFARHDYDAVINSLTTGLSPSGVRQSWTSTATPDGFNTGGYSSLVFDAHVDSAIRSPNARDARTHYRAAYREIVDDAPAVWLYEPRLRAGVNARVVTGPLRPDAWWATLPRWSLVPSGRSAERASSGASR